MFIARVQYENFRNLQSLDVPLNQGLVVLVGPNGSGKTNFLEGLYFGATLQRFPESKFRQFFRQGEFFFRVTVDSKIKEERRQDVFSENYGGRYKYQLKVNNQKTGSVKYSGLTPLISFLPQDLNLLTHSPAGRRRFLNETLSNVSPEYREGLKNYQKILRQRNLLLEGIKNHGQSISELDIWDEQLAKYGSLLTTYRKRLLDYINAKIGTLMESLSSDLRGLHLLYQKSGPESRGDFLKALTQVRSKEQQLGTTILGPHRDDFISKLGNTDLVGFISRGQMRSTTLALKILEKGYIEEHLALSPVLLLDDIFSELDEEHQKRIMDYFVKTEQIFITTTHLSNDIKNLAQRPQIFEVSSGVINQLHV